MSILAALQDLIDNDDSDRWYQASVDDLEPIDVAFDYHVASNISMRMLHDRGSGIGHRKGTVYHAICDREIKLTRTTRRKGQALCGAKLRDLSSSHEPVSCPKCEAIAEKLNLHRSIKHKVGAWV